MIKARASPRLDREARVNHEFNRQMGRLLGVWAHRKMGMTETAFAASFDPLREQAIRVLSHGNSPQNGVRRSFGRIQFVIVIPTERLPLEEQVKWIEVDGIDGRGEVLLPTSKLVDLREAPDDLYLIFGVRPRIKKRTSLPRDRRALIAQEAVGVAVHHSDFVRGDIIAANTKYTDCNGNPEHVAAIQMVQGRPWLTAKPVEQVTHAATCLDMSTVF